jgi:hypothetical protein
MEQRIFLLNCCVVPKGCCGSWQIGLADLSEIVEVLNTREVISCVGHASTAHILSTLTGYDIENTRREADPVPGDICYCFLLNTRAPEGKILTEEEIFEIGFSFRRMTYLSPALPS